MPESSFKLFTDLPITLKTSILTHALPARRLLICAFWDLNPDNQSYTLRAFQDPGFRDLQSIAQLNNPFLDIIPIRLRRAPIAKGVAPSQEETIFIRPKTDIVYFPFCEVGNAPIPEFAHFLSCEENQGISNLAMSIQDLDQYLALHFLELILGLNNLETLYILGGDERGRLLGPEVRQGTGEMEGVLCPREVEKEVELVKVQQSAVTYDSWNSDEIGPRPKSLWGDRIDSYDKGLADWFLRLREIQEEDWKVPKVEIRAVMEFRE
jgi:hypothetical protein